MSFKKLHHPPWSEESFCEDLGFLLFFPFFLPVSFDALKRRAFKYDSFDVFPSIASPSHSDFKAKVSQSRNFSSPVLTRQNGVPQLRRRQLIVITLVTVCEE